jgi:DNA-3-methyladenine glycosylase II
MVLFEYGEKETEYLKSRDKKLAEAIDRIGILHRETIPDLFQALVNSIVGQQISMKAWATVWKRMTERFDGVAPGALADAPVETIQKCGMTLRKAESIKELARKVTNGEFDIRTLEALPDDEVCRRLSTLKGIGRWTAEMVMIFSMQRPDVFSWDDLAIHRGLRVLHRHRTVTKTLFEKYRRRYSPHCTVASLYLWEIAGENPEPPRKKTRKKPSGKRKIMKTVQEMSGGGA